MGGLNEFVGALGKLLRRLMFECRKITCKFYLGEFPLSTESSTACTNITRLTSHEFNDFHRGAFTI